MKLTIHAEGHSLPLDVPDYVLQDGEAFFAKLDRDMDAGWQMGRQWVQQPDATERARIVADRLLSAMHAGSVELALMLAGYLLTRQPGLTALRFAESGEMSETELVFSG